MCFERYNQTLWRYHKPQLHKLMRALIFLIITPFLWKRISWRTRIGYVMILLAICLMFSVFGGPQFQILGQGQALYALGLLALGCYTLPLKESRHPLWE
jgi:hypothetical protein